MESPDRNSPCSAGEIQGSPLFNFLCSLSPIKPVKSARGAQTYSEISFPPPPAVFVSPRVGVQKDLSSLQRHQHANRVEEAQTASEVGPTAAQKEGQHVLLSSSQRAQRLRSVRKTQKNQSFASPCSSPSKLVEEYLADPVEDGMGTGEDDLETLPHSSICETRANNGNPNYEDMDEIKFLKQEEVVLTAIPELLETNGPNMGRAGLMEKRCTQDAEGPNSCSAISTLKHMAHQSGDVNNETILDFHQDAADLEFLMSEDVDESHHHSCMSNWHNVTSSSLSELSVEQVEGYIASLRGIVNEEQGAAAGLSTQLGTEVMADETLMIDNLEAEAEARGSQGGMGAACKVNAPHQRGVRRRCLDFEVSEGHVQSETSILSLKPMRTNSGKCQDVPSCGAESNRSLLVLKKRVSATLGATNNDSIQGFDACTECCSRSDGTASIKMTRATSINIKLSRCSSFKDVNNRLPCAKTSPVPAGMPSGIGLHLNSLTSSMPCTQMRDIDGSGGSVKPGDTLSGGMLASKLQGSPAESTQKCLPPLNPGKHSYAGSTAESRQGLVASVLETRMDDCEVQSECSDQDIDSSKSAICVQSVSLGTRQVQDVVPLNVWSKRPSPLDRKRVLLQDKHYQGELEVGEESSQSPYSPKKKRRSSSTAEKSGDGCKRCNCKKSKCLKLYCECFAAGVYCVDSCTCQGCFNKPEFEETVMDTRQQIESRNPLAFAPKIIRASEASPTKREDSRDTPASARHKRGCNCKKSHCLKKYCECFQAGVGCSDGCRCESCKNVHGRKEGAQDSDENDLQVEAVVNKELAEEHIGTSEFCTELIHGSQHQNHELSPITPAFQHGGQHRPATKSSSAIKRRGSLEALRSPVFSLSSAKPSRSPSRLPRSPSRLLRSCKGSLNSPPMASTGISLPKSGSSPVSTPRILRIGRFSPRWDGLDEICTLTPGLQAPLRPTPASASVLDRADLSPSINEQNCNELSSTGNVSVRRSSKLTCLTSPISQPQLSQCQTPANTQGTPGTQTFSPACAMDKKPSYEDSKAYGHQFMEDDGTPEFLKDPEPEYLPICLLNSSSPKHKRVSPPHHHAARELSHRGLQSPGVRSSRKFILQSIPSVPPTPFTGVNEKSNYKADT
eukprot:c21393_g1_i1 orf=1043-4429(+)